MGDPIDLFAGAGECCLSWQRPLLHFLLAEISYKLKRLKKGEEIDNAQIENYSSAFKFLILHHPVRPPTVVEGFQEMAIPHFCDNANKLVDLLQKDFHVVCHGHLHRCDSYRKRGLYCFDSGTATQKNKYSNSVHVIAVYDDESITVDAWRWNGIMFTFSKPEKYRWIFETFYSSDLYCQPSRRHSIAAHGNVNVFF